MGRYERGRFFTGGGGRFRYGLSGAGHAAWKRRRPVSARNGGGSCNYDLPGIPFVEIDAVGEEFGDAGEMLICGADCIPVGFRIFSLFQRDQHHLVDGVGEEQDVAPHEQEYKRTA